MFLSGYLNDCVQMVEYFGPLRSFLLLKGGYERGANTETIDRVVAHATDTIAWAVKMRDDGYHQINTISFLSEWAALEAGNENVVAAIIGTVRNAAEAAADKFQKGRFDAGAWPWSDDQCLEIAQKLDQKAKDKTQDRGWNASGRLVVLFGWLGVTLEIDPVSAEKFNEASMIRNVIVHRYGRLRASDICRTPHLAGWEGKTLPMTAERMREYNEAMVAIHLAISNAIHAKGWK
ncbi:hypothetical protein CBW56_03660 [Denitratisoma oestradiolicum]|nr:hypothetical protein CBW56_03660 [Denitratisoma oestradiolicum]